MRRSTELLQVKMNPIVAVLFLAVAVAAEKKYDHELPNHMKPFVDTAGKQYELYAQHSGAIALNAADQEDTFTGLNVHDIEKKEIDHEDLKIFYWYKDLKFAIKKFLVFTDDNKDGKVTPKELDNDFKKKPVKVALIECHYLKSPGLRQSCFADQLATYASLVLDDKDVNDFYKHIGGSDGISVEEAEALSKKDPKHAAEELGGFSDGLGVSEPEFKDYVTQESINDDFRRCRDLTEEEKGNTDFDEKCLKEELTEYIEDDLTELDISVLFRALDIDGKKTITKDEIDQIPGVDGPLVDKVMTLLDMSRTTPKGATPVVDYGEFRTYMKSPTVQIQAERDCTEKENLQKPELDCLYNLLVKLVKQEHDAIWLVVPDLEQQITFEIIDESNDGIIKKSELKYDDEDVKTRFIHEIDTNDNGDDVDLEEFNEYLDIPHMVYGVGDCLLKKRFEADGRVECYPSEIKSIFTYIKDLDKDFWPGWFKSYQTVQDNIIDSNDHPKLKEKFVDDDLVALFLSELGQGDKTVTLFEFTWYAKQQELASRYHNNFPGGNPSLDKFHEDLQEYIEDDITEYDVQQFFDKLDKDDDHELTQADFGAAWKNVEGLIKHIDSKGNDADNTANFREFWLWLQAPKTGENIKQVKDVFENECTKKIKGPDQQKKEIECYVRVFKEDTDKFVIDQ